MLSAFYLIPLVEFITDSVCGPRIYVRIWAGRSSSFFAQIADMRVDNPFLSLQSRLCTLSTGCIVNTADPVPRPGQQEIEFRRRRRAMAAVPQGR